MQEGSSHDFPDGEIFFIELLLFFCQSLYLAKDERHAVTQAMSKSLGLRKCQISYIIHSFVFISIMCTLIFRAFQIKTHFRTARYGIYILLHWIIRLAGLTNRTNKIGGVIHTSVCNGSRHNCCYHISWNSSMAAVIDEKIVRGHTLIILSPCHQGNHYILTPRKYYLQYKQKYDRLNRFGRLFVMAGSLPCIFW